MGITDRPVSNVPRSQLSLFFQQSPHFKNHTDVTNETHVIEQMEMLYVLAEHNYHVNRKATMQFILSEYKLGKMYITKAIQIISKNSFSNR